MLIKYPLKVVIVDDQQDVLDIMVAFLEDNDSYEVSHFQHPVAALKFIKDHDVAIVILDILMDGMYGDDLLRRIADLENGIETMVVTGAPTLINLQTCFRNGARAIIHKPFTQDEFIKTVGFCKESIDCWNKNYQELLDSKKK